MRSSERIVERVFKALLPEAELIYRTSQPTGEYDFDLRCRNGEFAALEVTELLDERWMKTQAAIHGKRVGGNVIKCRECKKTWLLIPINGADIPKSDGRPIDCSPNWNAMASEKSIRSAHI